MIATKKLKHVICKSAIYCDEKSIVIKFPWNPQTLSEIKTISGRKYHDKYWTVPLNYENCVMLKKLGYEFNPTLKDWANTEHLRRKNVITEIPNLKATLFPYQLEGVCFLEKQKGRGLIADEMGLGKTIQALAWLQLHKDKLPVVIVCPASLKYNWENEAKKFMDDPMVQILNGNKTNKLSKDKIIIINYDIVEAWLDELLAINPLVIICDEAHYIKNAGTKQKPVKRTVSVLKLCKKVPHIIALSGTPIESRPLELLNIIKLIDVEVFPSTWHFKQRYCDPKYNGFGWTFKGATNIPELYSILSQKIMIRRKKVDVLKELPDKIYSTIPIDINNRKEYESAENDFVKYLKTKVEIEIRQELHKISQQIAPVVEINDYKLERLKMEAGDKATMLNQIEKLKQISAKGKMDNIINWIDDFFENEDKLVLFCTHTAIINQLQEHYKKISVKIDGSVSTENRQLAVDMFQKNKNIKLFLGNMKAAGVGITLTAANHIGIIEYPWTPGELSQAIDRCHRIGQKNTVNVYFFVGKNTIDEKIIDMLITKQKILNGVLDGGVADVNLLEEVLKQY